MKSTIVKRSLICLLLVVLVLSLCVAVACDKDPGTVMVVLQTDKIATGEEVTVGVATSETYTVTTSHPLLVTYQDGKLKGVGSADADTLVTVTVTTESGAVGTAFITFVSQKAITVMVAQQTITDGETVMIVPTTSEFFTVETSHPQLIGFDRETSKLKVLSSADEDVDVTITVRTASGAVGTATIKYVTAFDPESVINLKLASSYIRNADTVKITVTIKDGYDKTDYTVTTDKPELVKNFQGNLVVVTPSTVSQTVKVTAYLNSNPNIKVTKSIQYLADEETITITPVDADGVIVNEDKSVSIANKGSLSLDIETSRGSAHHIYVADADAPYVTIDRATATITATGINKVQRVVTVIVCLQDDMDIYATLIVKISGNIVDTDDVKQSGDITFTPDMLTAWGNPSVTVNGTLNDIVKYLTDDSMSSTSSYDFEVKMEGETRWSGEWYAQGHADNVIKDVYFQGDADVTNSVGEKGKAMMTAYIDKNNQVAFKMVTDYSSVPAVWESQSLYNQIDSLVAYFADFVVDEDLSSEEVGVFKYTVDATDAESLTLMTRLTYCLTPMANDTLETIYFYVTADGLQKIFAETETIWYGASDDQNSKGDATSYTKTTFEVTLSNLGTTVVTNPSPFEATDPEQITHINALQTAIDAMAVATNYTFSAVDNSIYSPQPNPDDYMTASTSTASLLKSSPKRAAQTVNGITINSTINQVGLYGVVSAQQGIVITGRTTKYNSVSEGENPYKTDWSGYVNYDVYKGYNADFADEHIYPANTYDYFERSYGDNPSYVGKRKHQGTVSDVLPSWDFSAQLFECTGLDTVNGLYTYKLRPSVPVRDLAEEVSMHTNADDATSFSGAIFTIILDRNYNLVSVTFPYVLVDDSTGYVTTTFKNVGSTSFTTEQINDLFSNYTPRQWISSWSQLGVKYYYPNLNDTSVRYDDMVATTVLQDAYPNVEASQWDSILNPSWFLNIFGDTINGPFFEYKQSGVDGNGNKKYIKWLAFNASSTVVDENAKVANYDEIVAKIAGEFTEERGWKLDGANSGEEKNSAGIVRDRYITYVNESANIMIRFHNNMTAHFFIDIYHVGQWTLH